MRISPEELFIENLDEQISKESMQYMPKERALDALKKISGEDFEYDVDKWKKWLADQNRPNY
jgi:hypothetical protein